MSYYSPNNFCLTSYLASYLALSSNYLCSNHQLEARFALDIIATKNLNYVARTGVFIGLC